MFNPNPKPRLEFLLAGLAGVIRPLFPCDEELNKLRKMCARVILGNNSESHCPFCDREGLDLSKQLSMGKRLTTDMYYIVIPCSDCFKELQQRNMVDAEKGDVLMEMLLKSTPAGIC